MQRISNRDAEQLLTNKEPKETLPFCSLRGRRGGVSVVSGGACLVSWGRPACPVSWECLAGAVGRKEDFLGVEPRKKLEKAQGGVAALGGGQERSFPGRHAQEIVEFARTQLSTKLTKKRKRVNLIRDYRGKERSNPGE